MLLLFQDRLDRAGDNAEALFRYCVKSHPEHDLYFFVAKASPDYRRLREEFGSRVVAWRSVKSFSLLLRADWFISSHIRPKVLSFPNRKFKYCFLQHGALSADLSRWFNRYDLDLLMTSTLWEYRSIVGHLSPYAIEADRVKLTGLPRWDALLKYREQEKSHVLVMPTWITQINDPVGNNVYAKSWLDLSREIIKKFGANRLKFLPHPLDVDLFCEIESSYPEVAQSSWEKSATETIGRAAVVVTDGSSISFDVLYAGGSVVLWREGDRMSRRRQVRDASWAESPPRIGVQVESVLQVMQQLDGRKLAKIRTDQIFPNIDDKNSERVMRAILDS